MNMPKLDKSISTSKTELYRRLITQIESLLSNERDFIANAANFSSLIYHTLPDLSWTGFYIYKDGELVLGPFQGKPACVRIEIGKGVCGKAAEIQKTVVVENVHEFPGHIACDPQSNSEIVIPIIHENDLIGVLDLDSPVLGRFDAKDRAGLEALVKSFITLTDCT
jgi:GAF domain-containing protein